MSNVVLSTSVTRAALPVGWEVCPIESICSRVTSGGTPSRKEPSYYEGGAILWAKSSELKDWYVYDTSEKITQSGLESSSAKLLPKDTVLLALYGDGRTITSLGLLAKPATCNQACCAMICDPNKSEPQFLLYSLKHHRSELIGLASGASQRNLSGKILKQFPIAVPPLPTQRKIASILSAYDDLIENNTRRIAILEEMAQAIYREWFVNFRFPGHENVKLVDSPLGQIPEGWEVVTIGDIAKRNSESVSPSKHPDEYFEHFSLPAFDVNVLPVIEAGSSIKSNKTVVTQDSVLISKLNPRIPRVWLPFPSEETRSIGSTEFMIMRPEDGISREFLYSLFRSDEFHDRFAICSGGTSTSHQRVKPPNFLKLPVVLPTGEQMERFQPIVHPLLTLAQNKRIAIENLRTTRDLLLPKLISGKLDVEDLDIDAGLTAEALEEATA